MAYVLHNMTAATMATGPVPYGRIDAAAMVVRDGRIDWVGPMSALRDTDVALPRQDLGGRLVTPALIDCHTHVIHAGTRATEFELRLAGASYEQIARAGGGILSTVTATRAASEDDLVRAALPRIDQMIADGVAVIEIKSGYGLDHATELRMLRAARRIAKRRAVTIRTTFLGAHAVPPGMTADAYIDDVCIPALRDAHAQGLVDAVDGFCEGIAFSSAQIRRVFAAAQDLCLPVKLHADQLSNLRGAALAARAGALSADHLEYLDADGVRAMAAAGTVAVILPGAFYTLRQMQAPPIGLLRSHGVPMAVATDMNPGSSPMTSILLSMNMACTLFGLTPDEALAGTTRNAACALGLADRGTLAAGQVADLAVWDCAQPAELSWRIGGSPLHRRIIGGAL